MAELIQWLFRSKDRTACVDVKDNLEYDMKTRDAAMAKSQISWILQSDPHGHLHSQGHPKLYVRKADYKLLQLKKADTTYFVDSKSEHYKLLQSKKANTTNFVDSKSKHYKLLQSTKADTTSFCSLETTNFYSQSVNCIVFCSLCLTSVVDQ